MNRTFYSRVLIDPAASHWLKDAARKLETRDPVDALNDAQALLAICGERLATIGHVAKENRNGR